MRNIQEFKKEISKVSPVGTEFKVGDTVTFTNDYGIEFRDLTVIGFDKDDSFYGRFIFLDKDSYWFPVAPKDLKKQ